MHSKLADSFSYPAMATEFPGQVQCIFLRNTSSTDSGDKFPYNTKGFQGLDNSTYMFFNVPVSDNVHYMQFMDR